MALTLVIQCERSGASRPVLLGFSRDSPDDLRRSATKVSSIDLSPSASLFNRAAMIDQKSSLETSFVGFTRFS
jgi:hypothetical protein